jgi:O-antigen/teichoic acid export membrane protein
LIALIVGFYSGLGIYSFIAAASVDCLVSNSLLITAAAKSGILPKKNELKWPTMDQIKLLWQVGRDFFLSCLGSKLLYTSQSFLLARFAGLESVAIWVVGSKMFFLIRDLLGKASQMAGPLLIEMYVAKQYDKAGMRLSQAALGIGYLATFASGILILANPVFVQIWTNGKVFWPQYADAFLAFTLVAGILQTIIGHSIAMTMNLKEFRWISLKEALAFIALSCMTIPIYGITGMAAVQASCTLIFSTRFIFKSYALFVKNHNISFLFTWSTCWKMPIIIFISIIFVFCGWSLSLEKSIMSSSLFAVLFFILTFNDLKNLVNKLNIKY